MHQDLASRVAFDSSGTTSEVSQAVSTEGYNAVVWDATLYALTATNVSFQLQESNDLENWDDIQASGGGGFPGVTFTTGPREVRFEPTRSI